MKAIGVHTNGGADRNFACPISPGIINAMANQPEPKLLYVKDGIKYFSVDIPSENLYPQPLLDVEDAIPQSGGYDNKDGLFWVNSPET